MEPIVRAVDVGFGNTKYITTSSPSKMECSHFPSLAFYTLHDKSLDTLGAKRKTVCIPIDGIFYEVGAEVELAADRFRVRPLHDGYTETAEYRALLSGALHYMKVDTIDLLVLGLPVAQFLTKRAALEKSMAGTFMTSKKSRVQVKRVLVVAQPQGALFDYATQQVGEASAIHGKSLVIDAGSRTFDWLTTHGMKVISNMSHSVTRGVADILWAIAKRISMEIGEEFDDLEAIDLALRSGKSLRIYQKEYNMKRFEPVIQVIAEQAVTSLISRMDKTYNVENIVLVGGGAYLFRKAIKHHFPKHTIHEVAEPLYANVRGFQRLGEQYVRERPELFEQDASPSAYLTVVHGVVIMTSTLHDERTQAQTDHCSRRKP